MQPNKTKTVTLFAPHMAPLAAIASILGLDLATFEQLKHSTGLKTRDQLQQAAGLASAIPLMDIKKSEHVTEVTTASAKLISAMKSSKMHNRALVSQLTEHLVDVGNKLTHNFHQKQNGAGAQTHVDPTAKHHGKSAGIGAATQ